MGAGELLEALDLRIINEEGAATQGGSIVLVIALPSDEEDQADEVRGVLPYWRLEICAVEWYVQGPA